MLRYIAILLVMNNFILTESAPPMRSQSLRPLTQNRATTTTAIEKPTGHSSSSSSLSSEPSLTAEHQHLEPAIEKSEIIHRFQEENVIKKQTYITNALKQLAIITTSAAITYESMNYINNNSNNNNNSMEIFTNNTSSTDSSNSIITEYHI